MCAYLRQPKLQTTIFADVTLLVGAVVVQYS
jgi:hypothetical protein